MTVLERFLKYVRFDTTSCEESDSCPSTEKQLLLGRALADELRELGLLSVRLDENGYVYGFLPASEGREVEGALGLIAHMDTAPAVSGTDVKPSVIKYEGGDITLPHAVISQDDFPFLSRYVGEELVVGDGSTLLGGDDKAGIAEIFTAVEFLCRNPSVSHRAIAVCITPDEEIGRGADRFPLHSFEAREAYTVDGGELGEIEFENFNAAACTLTVHGINIHPGSAKNKMKNAVLLANEFISLLPPAETPSHTEGYEGFYHVCEIEGNETLCTLKLIIRDHDMDKFLSRKQFLRELCGYLNTREGESTFVCEITDSYYNMKEKILPAYHLIENAERAMREAGVTPQIVAIRGGTDGARLSFEGLPCPNLSTGGANFHSIHEFVPVRSMEKMVEVILNLVK